MGKHISLDVLIIDQRKVSAIYMTVHIRRVVCHFTDEQCPKRLPCNCKEVYNGGCTTSTYIYHHCRLLPLTTTTQSKCSICAMAGWKSTTNASCSGWYHHMCKWTICTSGQMKKHHHDNYHGHLCQVECLHQLKEGNHHKHQVQRSGCKVQSSGHKAQWSGQHI